MIAIIAANGWFFLEAARYALVIFALSTIASLVLSFALGTLASLRSGLVRVPVRILVEFVRDVPQVVNLFFVFFGAPTFGLEFSPLQATIVSLSLWGGANGAEIVRGGVAAVPRHQFESARALGVHPALIFTSIILPQAVRPIVPAYTGLLNILMQSTSLGALVGVTEFLKSAQIIIERSSYYQGGAPGLSIYGFILLIYYVTGLAMNAGIRRIEVRLGLSTTRTAAP